MTFPPEGAARSLCLAADEALTAAAFCTGDFAEADRLFTQAQALAARAGDGAGEAFATGGLAMVLHHRNLGKLIDGSAPADTDVEAEEELMRRALVIWQETGDAAGTARGAVRAEPGLPGAAPATGTPGCRTCDRRSAWPRPPRKPATCTGARRSTGTWASTTSRRIPSALVAAGRGGAGRGPRPVRRRAAEPG